LAELKTRPHDGDVSAFLDAVEHPTRRDDSRAVCELMQKVTGEEPVMWGPSIVGFGTYRYRYESGREGDWMLVGFSPRKQSLTLYIMTGFSRYEELMAKLGKHKTGKSCLYVNKLADVDMGVLEELVRASVEHLRAKYPPAGDT
ncbi:MAG: DUF1801 domain-containing protein, partial [Holophagales bacterium]|nr:DUF1801 domain-containing protein [Holophagales bacterium]